MVALSESLSDGERVKCRTRLHWSVLVHPLIGFAVLLTLVVGLALRHFYGDALALLAIALVWPVAVIVRRQNTECVVTNRRVVGRKGLVVLKDLDMLLAKIESVEVEQGLIGRWLDFGNLILCGTGGTKEVFEQMERPRDFKEAVLGGTSPGR